MKKNIKSKTDILRQKAEEQLNTSNKLSTSKKPFSDAENLKFLQELEIHQIELEMQNEELVIAKEKAELAKEKYTELYNFAPTGYLSLSQENKIKEINFSAAKMLGKDRLSLIDNRFDVYISDKTRPVFNIFIKKVFTSETKETCEVIIEAKENLPINVNIEGIVSQNGELCFLNVKIVEKLT
jgi:PAS domain-containing protein